MELHAQWRLYRKQVDRWLPDAALTAEADKGAAPFDATLTWRRGGTRLRYVVEIKPHFPYQDASLLATHLRQKVARLKKGTVRPLLLAPYVRPQQGLVLERAGIDYVDLVGNAHLDAPGLFVHVEGRRADRVVRPAQARFTKGWIRTVMAALLRPDIVRGPYRPLAHTAGVALGTVTACIRDLETRGFLAGKGRARKLVETPQLVALWVEAYVNVLRPRLIERRLQVRAEHKAQLWERVQQVLGKRKVRWALTGADAAERLTHYFHTEDTEIYVDPATFEDRGLLVALQAQPALRTGNLRAIEPPGPLAMETTVNEQQAVPTAPLLLTYAELRYRGTDQAREAADLLLPRLLNDVTARA